MRKLALALCLVLVPVLSLGATQAQIDKKKPVVAIANINSAAISSIKKLIFTETIYTALKEVKGISILPQSNVNAVNLNIQENNKESIEKAADMLKTDKIICCYIGQSDAGFSISYYIFDGRSRKKLYSKYTGAADSVSVVGVLRNIIAGSTKILETAGIKAEVSNDKAEITKTPEETGKPELLRSENERLNLEVSLYDFVDKYISANYTNTWFFAVNYKLLTDSKNLAVNFSPFFAMMRGANELGLRISGFYYPSPESLLNGYVTVSAGGSYGFTRNEGIVFFETKLGFEILVGPVEFFAEGGADIRNSTPRPNLLINSGLRYYIF